MGGFTIYPHQDCRRSKLLTDWTLKSQQPTSALRTIEAPVIDFSVLSPPPLSTYGDDFRAPQASLGEAPFFLAGAFCRWDSQHVRVSFGKTLSRALSKEVPTVPRYDTQSGLSTSDLKLRSNPSLFNNCTATLPANLNPGGTWKADAPVYESLFPPGATKKSSLKIDSNRLTFYCQDDPTETSDNPLIKQLTPIETKWELA
ncbi:hypothetical protein MJO28_012559 [Puccinia striiformis f. sp. tritici]|uniref:Uncharacterized protein n=1 Tax=Puccinia striiformis f. sp. tritici TaxID=168172 RepID=A0ACC0E0T5_9BASI|nr:hypothetical protein MJO28_012559 [Puccinia striiformis f. sp. tritici]KAI7945489.1 hypothetical protein MJO29_011877 [Puccinia striiformis f. sp. tritici]